MAGTAPGITGAAFAAAETAVFAICNPVMIPVNVEIVVLIPSIIFVKTLNVFEILLSDLTIPFLVFIISFNLASVGHTFNFCNKLKACGSNNVDI